LIQSAAIAKFWRFTKLEVVAVSSRAPNVSLEVVNYGKLKYSSRTGKYGGRFWTYGTIPALITVKSSGGGSATAFVTR
jgi:hypothetical protein